jgi:NADH-quinone oxidoreductase subunit G
MEAISVDGKEIEATEGELVIDACERAGIYIPRFCYHPRMRPVGMCRMCIVEIDTGRGPALQPSCMIPVSPGMTISTQSEATTKAQDGVLEFLLINHPLDCPVCDKGGECPLQDQTLAYGPGESRFVEEKRHFEKPIPVNENVYLDRERCILCDRCTRFAKEVAGDPLISFQDRGNQTQVNTFPDHPFASYFAGNTVQICPVGALTARPYRFRARPWDLEQVESTCQSCAVGCRVVIDSSRNEVLRYNGVDIDPVNWGWMCDKGRFDFQSVQHPDRLVAPLVRGDDGELTETRWSEAFAAAATAVVEGLERSGPGGVAVLGGARLTTPGPSWPRVSSAPTTSTPSSATAFPPMPCSACPGPPSTTCAPRAARCS